MAFLRFSRDKRGYEHFSLVEPITRRGKTRTRVLYWFRTPPGVKVGREPFDEETRRALEAKNPSVVFEWKKIMATPIPSADADKWRERRREEKAARRARKTRQGPAASSAVDAAEPREEIREPIESLEPGEPAELADSDFDPDHDPDLNQ
jgi:hypothetical protein